eukprot:gnl/MRDRNA2_/MRDRNA2_45222_c0_seq1.p1 gnl/MRDRNA2_/MRDRNA2_45222_c0~~gnl/MRDRNA2_/MRDRNA2_45222_c0_seq1.p1  ORF type:complete len:296 (-),score=56.43 gnl/MRDRNA2_/MRDRNA2_45222_c0_seq1:258-1145(-)
MTCMLPPMPEDDYLERAVMTPELAIRYQIEMTHFTATNVQESCLPIDQAEVENTWKMAHYLSAQGVATRLCYRKDIETKFRSVISWWIKLDPEHHFASVKQGTMLTAMIRGGAVAMMPWDNDLEFMLLSSGPNPMFRWCGPELRPLQARKDCIYARLGKELGSSVRGGGPENLEDWLHDKHGVFEKVRVEVDETFDIDFVGWIPRPSVSVNMFRGTQVYITWSHWEWLFFEIFGGDLVKKVGSSGNLAAGARGCAVDHNACIQQCQEKGCITEFADFFAHTQDQFGDMFPVHDDI